MGSIRKGTAMIAKTRGNTAEFVHQQLLDDLQRGTLLPGDKLTTEALARRYDVSRTPVREALIRLEREGVVDAVANAGYEIRTPTLDELYDMYEIREALEGLAVARLAERGASPELLDALRRSCEQCRNAVTFNEKDQGDRRFHTLICDGCGSETLQGLVRNYLVLSTVFNVTRYLLKERPNLNKHDINLEHENVIRAIETGDAKLARKLLCAHIANARKLLKKLMSSNRKKRGSQARAEDSLLLYPVGDNDFSH